ncbi:DUF6976 family protein [Hydrogenophaga sp. MI9]|uniref:DUF6976 family protein n=1 Tax=Hydrogenophaga sp. MI9 TaxID=3453719 RepID=UPI003EEBF6BC
MNRLMTLAETAELIRGGAHLSLAGPESALDALPKGHWIAGTIPYFMDTAGGVVSTGGQVFVSPLPAQGQITLAHYGADQLKSIVGNGPDNGFTVAIVPAGSTAHNTFAAEAVNDADAFLKPTVGWVAGIHLSDLGKATPKVYLGSTGEKFDDGVVVAHVALPESQLASIEIVNIFEPGDGDTLRFTDTSFEVGDCLVNGEKTNLADYVQAKGLADGKLPLVGDFGGAHINASIQSVDAAGRKVVLYAPVFTGVDYHFARPVADYGASFRERLAGYRTDGVQFSCNCILNFLFGELEGQHIGDLHGPVTFGEIGYQLLNQTLVVLRID